MRRLILSTILVVQILSALAQGKMLEPEEIITNRTLYPSGLTNIQWQGNSGFFTWQEGSVILRSHVKKEAIDTLYHLESFNKLYTATGKEALKRLPYISWKDENTMEFAIGQEYYIVKDGSLSVMHSLPDTAQNTDEAPITGYMAYTVDNDLFISTGGRTMQVTSDSDKGLSLIHI